MFLSIAVHGTSALIFLLSLLEFCFLVPILLYTRKRNISFKDYLRNLLRQSLNKRDYLLYPSIIVGICSVMFLVPTVGFNTGLIHIFWGNPFLKAQAIAIDNANEFSVIEPTPIDIPMFFMISLILAFNEEIFFRGFLLKVDYGSLGKRINISSISFALYHVIPSFNIFTCVYFFPYYFTWGIILCLMQQMGHGYLVLPISLHFLFNFILFAFM
ncbi:CPBP family intramembrane metalloprotease [Candidatus Bathyarchaeota archaeon]|nr:CPBP family intramembrane metalloprotease [Candidatus Bathyarchaeota archaeon]